jgi:uncharacterized membrane protein
VEGLGVATPAWGTPTMTAFIVFLINYFSPISCATQIAYVGGTLGTLIGVDLLNIGKLPVLVLLLVLVVPVHLTVFI